MAPPSQTQLAWRRRIEAVLRLAEPGLDLVLAAGDRVSRAVDREELDWTPPRAVAASSVPRGVGPGAEPVSR